MKIENYLHWNPPQISITDDEFDIEIVDDEINIEVCIEGYSTRLATHGRIPLADFMEAIAKYQAEVARRKGIENAKS